MSKDANVEEEVRSRLEGSEVLSREERGEVTKKEKSGQEVPASGESSTDKELNSRPVGPNASMTTESKSSGTKTSESSQLKSEGSKISSEPLPTEDSTTLSSEEKQVGGIEIKVFNNKRIEIKFSGEVSGGALHHHVIRGLIKDYRRYRGQLRREQERSG